MKKLREIKNRSKVKIKKILGIDEPPTRPSTPIQPGNAGDTVPPTDRITPPGPCGPSVETSHTAPGVDQVPSHTPSIHTSALASNLSSAPAHHCEESQSLVVEQGPATSPSALAQPQAPARLASRTSGLEMAPSAAKTSGRDKASPSTGTGLWSEAKSEAWTGFKSFLDTISQAASISGLGPIKTVAEGFADCIGIFEDVGQSRKDYDELRLQLDSIFGELSQYISASPVITISIQSICGSI
ncbi:unnamed protein product [Rhizoctonia solani]|uniref:Uncharacterized protein n=1 Tax=Rhizoctonia solani TaxID=456999 RepID=A0A8H3E858_9AGAM|nr:unnamed protein product [Rhizoctonia solani]